MEEIWKDITGYEGHYKISNYGKVYSAKTNKMLTPEVLDKGYLRIGLMKNGERKRFLVHRLVLCEFLEYRSYPEFECNHKDMNTQNNYIDNLEWVTNQENCDHKFLNKPELIDKFKKSMSNIGKKYSHLGIEASKKKVYRYDLDGNFIDMKNSAREYAHLGFNYKNISAVCNGDKKTHKGHIFSFKKLH